MRRWYAIVVLALCAGVAIADKPSISKFITEAGRYSVEFPTRPSKLDADKSLATSGGNLTVVMSKAEKDGIVFSVTYTDYPESFNNVSASRILDGVIDRMKGDDGQVSGDGGFEVDGGSGRAVTITAGENVVKSKVALVGRRLYLVQACGKKEPMRGRSVDDFLASFRLTK